MRIPKVLGTVLLVTLALGTVVGPAAPATGAPFDIVRESHVVSTDHGDIYLEVARPVRGGKMVKGPVILTYSPYSVQYQAEFGNRTYDADRWVPQGYVRVVADLIGTGNSGGCFDYGGSQERATGGELVEWLSRQPWSTGRVAMTGSSYEGATAIATATTTPPHLTTIVPESAVSSWYHYTFSGGVRYLWNDEFAAYQGPAAATSVPGLVPLTFDFGLALPPPLDVSDPGWMDRVASSVTPCEELDHTQRALDDTPDYDGFWKNRDYVRSAGKIDVPVLIAHTWGDWDVKQEHAVNLYRALRKAPEVKLFMGGRWTGHDAPGGNYDEVLTDWLDHYLLGRSNSAERLPDVISQTATSDGPGDWYEGRWPKTKPVKLLLQEVPRIRPEDYIWQLALEPVNNPLPPSTASWPSTGANTELHANHHPHLNHEWFWFQSPPLKKDMQIFGEIKVVLWSTVYRDWVTFAPQIVDFAVENHTVVAGNHVATDPEGLVSVTRGWLDSRYRKGLDRQVLVDPGTSFGMTVVEKPQDYTFKKGHLIGLQIATEIIEWHVPKIYPCNGADCPTIYLDWKGARSKVILPVVNPPKDLADLFAGGHAHP